MIKHYFHTAWRNLWKRKVFSGINIIGLATGLTCCLLMGLYIRHETSYDSFQQKGDRIARVIMEYGTSTAKQKGNFTSTKVLPTFKQNFPEVETGVRMWQAARIVSYGDKLLTEKKFLFADSTFFDLFSFPLLHGDPAQALSGPRKMVLSASTAKKYFGNEDPVGKIMKIGSMGVEFQVTGVAKDCPSNSQIKFDFLVSFSSLGTAPNNTYWNANYTTFLLLKDKGSFASLQAKIPGFMKKEMAGAGGLDYVNFELEPFNSIHLHSTFEGFEPNNSITYIYIVSAIAILILLIACFTYINLSTARSLERAKEVGIRKVTGAYKKQIFWQFISESVILAFLALLISGVLAFLLLPAFNQLTDLLLTSSDLFNFPIILSAVLIVLAISFLAGSYPAFVLSGFKPIKVLKGSFKTSNSGLLLRRSLIVFQFAISAFLVISTFIIQQQLYYLQHKKLGYDRDHVLILPLDQKMVDKLTAIKTEFKSIAGISNVSMTVDDPSAIKGGYSMRRADQPVTEEMPVTANPVDEEFVKTTGLQLIAGNDLTGQDIKESMLEDSATKKMHFIINESAAKALGWSPQEAVGKNILLGDDRPGVINGVVKDFHFSSLHNPIKPLVLFSEGWGTKLLVKMAGRDMTSSISQLEAKWKTLVPHRPFDYNFLDQQYTKLYTAELRVGKVLNIFATIAILLASLGLFGLSAYSIQQRTKEIGVRKVLGASSGRIAIMLSKQFVRLVLIAFMVAIPLAWFLMNKWLQDFTYRIQITWIVFIITGVATVLIALLTVSFQAIKAAVSNPVKALRTE